MFVFIHLLITHRGHPKRLLWRRGGFFSATSVSWLRTVCTPLLPIFWGQGIHCSVYSICSLRDQVEESRNLAEALCSPPWRFPVPVALPSPGMDLWAAPGSLCLIAEGSFPWGVAYWALRRRPQVRTEAWNIRENQPHLLPSHLIYRCLQQLSGKLPRVKKKRKGKVLAPLEVCRVCQGQTTWLRYFIWLLASLIPSSLPALRRDLDSVWWSVVLWFCQVYLLCSGYFTQHNQVSSSFLLNFPCDVERPNVHCGSSCAETLQWEGAGTPVSPQTSRSPRLPSSNPAFLAPLGATCR